MRTFELVLMRIFGLVSCLWRLAMNGASVRIVGRHREIPASDSRRSLMILKVL